MNGDGANVVLDWWMWWGWWCGGQTMVSGGVNSSDLRIHSTVSVSKDQNEVRIDYWSMSVNESAKRSTVPQISLPHISPVLYISSCSVVYHRVLFHSFTLFLVFFFCLFVSLHCYLQPNTNQKLTCTWPDINWLCEDGGCGCGDCWLVGCVGGDGLNVEFCEIHINATEKKERKKMYKHDKEHTNSQTNEQTKHREKRKHNWNWTHNTETYR